MPRLFALLAAGVGALALTPRHAAAAPPPDEREVVAQVNGAINRGVQFLRTNQRNGNWEGYWVTEFANMQGGVTALATLALLNCGEKADSPTVKPALAFLRGLKPASTYVTALTTMALAEARQPRDLPLIQANVDWLLKYAARTGKGIGGWSYWTNPGEPDASNTQYALLGLYAGKQAGANIPAADWESIYQLYLTSQRHEPDNTGSWSYSMRQRGGPGSFTMTTAGVSGLVIADLGRGGSQQLLDPKTGVAAKCGQYDANDAMERGLAFIGANFSFNRPKNAHSTFYNTYGIERVGRLSGQRFLGRHDWYREGCEFLVKEQLKGGGWVNAGGQVGESEPMIATCFALLFLSKGRTPVLVSKLAYGDLVNVGGGANPVLLERGAEAGVINWNRKHGDARNLTDFASRELFNGLPLGWQVYDPRRVDLAKNEDLLAEVGVLVQSPILYITGHERPQLRGQQRELLKRYIEEGGFVLAEACCGSPEFAKGFREMVRDLFPDSPLTPMPPDHPIWQSHFVVKPTEFPKLECLQRGCRTVMVFSPEPLAGYWEETRFMPTAKKQSGERGEEAFRLGGNVIAYATGMEPPAQRLKVRQIVDATKEKSPPRGFLQPAQLRVPGESEPAPAAMRNLMAHVRTATRVDVTLEKESLTAEDSELFKYKFLYLHGRKRFEFSEAELANLRVNLQSGGLLLADACCGKPEFDQSFRAMAAKLFPDSKLVPIPADDELYSAKVNGAAITSVKRREKASTAGADVRYDDLPPALEGIKIDGQWVVIYSKYDLGCSLEGHRSSDCLGHTRESALQLGTAAVLYLLKK